MAELSFIPLNRIEMIHNYRDVEPVAAGDPDVIELSQSILKLGVLQPVLARPKPGSSDKYQLIFGHRRYVACGVAKLEMIPCNIQTVDDADILELQVTENLQRKDVHAMDEAIAFRSLMAAKSYSVDDIAARFAKKVEFITQRLKLNDLLPAFQKIFKKGVLTAGQAFVICRLRKEDQEILRKEWKDEEFPTASVWDVQDWIESKLLRNLSKAPFKKDDGSLTTAGPCNTCTKRSGCGNLLFADLKEDDRCFDATCFEKKIEAHFLLELKKTIETKPEVHIIANEPAKISKEVKELLRQMNVPIVGSDKFQRYGGYGKMKKQARGFHLDGWEKGKTEAIYVEGPEKAEKKGKGGVVVVRTVAEIDEELKGLKDRQQRASELDVEKIHKATLKQLIGNKAFEKPGLKHQGLMDRGIMVFLLLEKAAGFAAKDTIEDALKKLIPETADDRYAYQPDYLKKLGGLTDDHIAFICRVICKDHWGDPDTKRFGIGENDTTMRVIAEYLGVDVKAIEANQKIDADKRIERANKRSEALKKEKKELSKATPKEAKEKKPAAPAKKKAAAKTPPPLKRLIDLTDAELEAAGKRLSSLPARKGGVIEDNDPLGIDTGDSE